MKTREYADVHFSASSCHVEGVPKSLGRLFVVSIAIVLAITNAVPTLGAFAQGVQSPNTVPSNVTLVVAEQLAVATASGSVLIYGPSVIGSPSAEETLASNLGYSVTVADAVTWSSLSAADFAAYKAIIFGDPNCAEDPSPLATAEANKTIWAAAVKGPRIIIGNDPVYHLGIQAQAQTLISNGIAFAAGGTLTGLYVDLSCYYSHVDDSGTSINLLSSLGSFVVRGQFGVEGVVPDDVNIVAPTHPAMLGLTDEGLSNWGSSMHEFFLSYPSAFEPLAVNGLTNTPFIIASGGLPKRPVVDYFALGDSIASGHGLMDGGAPCYRSTKSYPYKVLADLRTRYERVNFVWLACSGATTLRPTDDILAESPYKWIRRQVSYVVGHLSSRPTLVSITIGANDFHFTDPLNFYYRLAQPGSSYLDWATQTKLAVGNALVYDVGRLLDHPNVKVVITQVHNPANQQSKFFTLFPLRPCANVFSIVTCYDRYKYAVDLLNTAYILNVYVPLGRPNSLKFALLTNADFSSPRLSCGKALPLPADTLVQYPGEQNINSMLPSAVRLLWGLGNTPGDCFHPNYKGAKVYADAVNAAALRMNR